MSRSNRTDRQSDNGFYDLGIAPNFMREINRLNFKNPTPIQAQAIPAGNQGDDIIAVAQTGSGKTLAFGIPMLQRLSKSKRGSGLVLVPTRELAMQVAESLQPICRSAKIRSVVLIGGASMSYQRQALAKNPRLIIATPGRLMDHIERKSARLSNVEVFILDEADRMLDMGFVPDVKKILKSVPDKRQTMLFSATMPKEIEAIGQQFMKDPTRIEIDRSGATPAEVSHEMFVIRNQEKSRLLAVRLRQCNGPVLVFTRTKRMASKLTLKVNNMGFAAAEIHSNRSQGQRQRALAGFKRGDFQVLIATDIAARGIDVSGIELVVNYDMPANSEDYVHRIGRTGRAGKSGHAISFATSEQRGYIRSIERFMKTRLAISAIPTLPSESFLLKKADQWNSSNEPSRQGPARNESARGQQLSRRPSSANRSSKRPDFKKRDGNKNARRRIESKQDEFRRKESQGQDSRRDDSARNVTRPKNLKPVDSNQNDINKDKPFWSIFKKSRSPKKKSVGQGSKRKNRSKRK